MYVVGLTGGIGSGKSEVARAFAALGVEIADADEAAHAVTAKGEAGHRAVIDAFGPEARAADGGTRSRLAAADGVRGSRRTHSPGGNPASAGP